MAVRSSKIIVLGLEKEKSFLSWAKRGHNLPSPGHVKDFHNVGKRFAIK